MTDELKRREKEEDTTHFKVLYQHLLGGTEKKLRITNLWVKIQLGLPHTRHEHYSTMMFSHEDAMTVFNYEHKTLLMWENRGRLFQEQIQITL